MGWMEFVSSLVGHVLSWPVLLLCLAVLFRRPIRALMQNVVEWEGPAGRFTFGEKLAQAEEQTEQAAEKISEGVSGREGGSGPEVDGVGDDLKSLLRDADTNPSFAVVRAWEIIRQHLRDLAEETGDGRLVRAGSELSSLMRQEILLPPLPSILNDLRQLRNRVAHGHHNPTGGEAVTYVETAREISGMLASLRAMHVRQRTSDET